MEEEGYVSMKFIIFLKTTLGKMVAINVFDHDFINLQFWQKWPRKFYNIKSYDCTKDEFEKDLAAADDISVSSEQETQIFHTPRRPAPPSSSSKEIPNDALNHDDQQQRDDDDHTPIFFKPVKSMFNKKNLHTFTFLVFVYL